MSRIASPSLRHNFAHLYADVAWFGVLAGSTLYFQSIYAARLGASSFQIGLISAGPAIVALLLTLPAGRWLEGKHLIKASFISSLAQRSWFLLFAALPWLFPGPDQIWAVVGISLVMAVPGVLLAIAFNATFADVVPPEFRGEVVGRRNSLVAVSLMLTNVMCGQVLDRLTFPLNYQVVFGLGALGALMSSYHLGRLRPLEPDVNLAAQKRGGRKALLRLDLLRGSFGLFMLAYLTFYTFQYMPIPLFTLAFVNGLKLTDGQLSLGNSIFYLLMTLVSLGLGYLSQRVSHRKLLVTMAVMFTHYPLLLGLVWQQSIFWVISATGGAVYGLISGGQINRLMERVPENDRPAHMALHNLALNLGILLGSFTGPLLGEIFDLRVSLLLAGVLRLAAAFLLWRWG
jgi:MFS family permease